MKLLIVHFLHSPVSFNFNVSSEVHHIIINLRAIIHTGEFVNVPM
jgi:hypothetical protein